MNEINKFLLARDKLMPEMHIPFTKNKEKIQKFKETGDSRYIYQNKLDKPCFQHDMTYGDFKDLTRRTASDKILHEKTFNTAKNPKYNGYQHDLLQWSTNFLIKNLLRLDINLLLVLALKMKIYQTKN